MDWKTILYGLIVKSNEIYVIQKSDENYSLWVVDCPKDGLPNTFSIEDFIEKNINDGFSVSGNWDDIQNELKELL